MKTFLKKLNEPKNAMARHWTIRVRLTVLYGGLFALAGVLLLGATYVLVEQRLDQRIGSGDSARGFPLAGQLTGRGPLLPGDGRTGTTGPLVKELEARQDAMRDDMLESLLTQGAIALAGVGLMAMLLGWLVAGRALRPVHGITETARRIAGAAGAERGLHERIALAGPPDEIKELADTFDLMLERLDRSFDGQRRFIASASHEMRTPLAVNRALIEVAITRPGASADARELGESLLKTNDRHERLIDGLLTLADARNEPAERHPVDLAEIAAGVLAEAAAGAGRHRVQIRPADLRGAPTTGDPYLLERLVQNLVENAVRHNVPEGGWLTARTRTDGDRAVLEVSNTGPVIHPYETEALFQPFRRLGKRPATGRPEAAERGFGLGLSVVRAIAESHGGRARGVPREGGGLTVRISVPAQRPAAGARPPAAFTTGSGGRPSAPF